MLIQSITRIEGTLLQQFFHITQYQISFPESDRITLRNQDARCA